VRRRPDLIGAAWAIGAAAALLLAVTPGAAHAHAELLESEPGAGATVPEGVDSVRLTLVSFDPEGEVSVEVTDAAGDDVTVGETEVDARTSTVEVAVEPLAIGEHIVHWHAMADDGDGLSEGTFTFRVKEAQGGGWGIWLVWLFALGVPAAIFLRPGARRKREQ
jgi:methionine-rich copper-binding protein CopC